METIIIESADSKTIEKIKDFLKKLNVTFKTKKIKEEKPYDPAFVEMVLSASQEEGGKIIDPNNLWESIKS